MKPVVDRLAQDYQGRADVVIVDLSTGEAAAEKLASDFGVQYVPTFAFTDSDGTRRGEIVGETTQQELSSRIDALK